MARITRRSFLEHSLIVAAAGLAAAKRTRGADSDQVASSGGSSIEQRPRVGVAVIGLHGRGLEHVDAYTYDDGVEVAALCDVDESTFAKAQAKLQERGRRAARQYTDVRRLLEDKQVDALSIATPRQSDLNSPGLEGHLSSAMCHLANISYRLAGPQAFAPRTDALGDDVDMREAFGRFEQHLADNALRLREMSYQLGPRLAFDPRSETFAGNAKADALLSREYRRPFVVPERI